VSNGAFFVMSIQGLEAGSIHKTASVSLVV